MDCENCLHSLEGEIDGSTLKKQLLCRRYPPSQFPVATQQGIIMMSGSPAVSPDGLCGEFKFKQSVSPIVN